MSQLYYYYHRSLSRLLRDPAILLSIIAVVLFESPAQAQRYGAGRFQADHPYIQYTGRVDFTNPKLPRIWQPGVYITIRFKGHVCSIVLNDEVLWGKNHNYIEVVMDGKAKRLQTKSARDTIDVSEHLSEGEHTLVICKNTEANIGYIELVNIIVHEIVKPLPKSKRKIEFIGNSITCGTGSDVSEIPCGKGVWQDQHNAYKSYGPVTARALNAQYHLSAVSGIGLMHSCCNMNIIMPAVFDKVSMRNDTIPWDFSKYQPDVVTVCLGQNDGIQDSASFCNNYIAFLKQVRMYYPKATIICLTSPAADGVLAAFMKKTLNAIVKTVNDSGDKKITRYFFSKQYHNGCDGHPDLAEHQLIAKELTTFIKKTMKW
ncbi:MAG TPA: SGNH/GDSL hydrolase family protein [Chitinophagaceae bacterium]|nr:SGNH/GDSL hydrolase family protein [Chitinophagaceae bacterium]